MQEQIERLRQQIGELKAALRQNQSIISAHRASIEAARFQLEKLMDATGRPYDIFCELPTVLQNLSANKLIGAALLSIDGNVLLHSVGCHRVLPLDPLTNKLRCGSFFDETSGACIEDEELPWNRCLQSEEPQPNTRLLVRQPGVDTDLHFEIACTALRKSNGASGAWVLFLDVTERLKAESYVEQLIRDLQHQLEAAQCAGKDLEMLAEKMGVSPWSPESESVQAEESEPSGKVLIVDDIPVNQKLLVMLLKKLGVEIALADDGEQAVQMYKQEPYALILMDCDMPGMDGFAATTEIRKFEGQSGKRTAIVAMTSYDRPGDREKCMASGMDDYVAKGSNITRLRELIEKYVFGKKVEVKSATAAPQQSAPRSAAQFDIKSLQDTYGDETGKVVSLFFGSTTMLINCLDFAIQVKDAQAVTHFAFSLKGACAGLGLDSLATLAAGITSEAQKGAWVEAADQLHSLRAQVADLTWRADVAKTKA
jgi:CheY-like chemotaxis protein/HPt (histidine-containing phosphotransfer) domain-containing protein